MSIVRPPARGRRARVAAALLVLAAGSALVPLATTATARTTHRLVFKMSRPSRQNVVGAKGVLVTVRCSEVCTVDAFASSSSPSFRTAQTHTRVHAESTAQIKVPLSATQVAALEADFKSGRSSLPILTVHATAEDSFGSRVPLKIGVQVARP